MPRTLVLRPGQGTPLAPTALSSRKRLLATDHSPPRSAPQSSCQACSYRPCPVGNFRQACAKGATEDASCTPCTFALPEHGSFVTGGLPYLHDNCHWECAQGHYKVHRPARTHERFRTPWRPLTLAAFRRTERRRRASHAARNHARAGSSARSARSAATTTRNASEACGLRCSRASCRE